MAGPESPCVVAVPPGTGGVKEGLDGVQSRRGTCPKDPTYVWALQIAVVASDSWCSMASCVILVLLLRTPRQLKAHPVLPSSVSPGQDSGVTKLQCATQGQTPCMLQLKKVEESTHCAGLIP